MEWLTKFLSSGVWGGISGLLAIAALLMTLKQPAKWISSHNFTRWLSTIPWVGLVWPRSSVMLIAVSQLDASLFCVQDGTLTVDSSVNPSRVLWELPTPCN
jgi:hypothetical protein